VAEQVAALTLNLDTTKVPRLSASNIFTGNQTVNGNLSATGAVSGSTYQIGSNLFAYGSFSSGNASLGFGGNTTMRGSFNTAIGKLAMSANIGGNDNTASGYNALSSNTSGGSNTAIGYCRSLSFQQLLPSSIGWRNISILARWVTAPPFCTRSW